jgi:hypothetical protein
MPIKKLSIALVLLLLCLMPLVSCNSSSSTAPPTTSTALTVLTKDPAAATVGTAYTILLQSAYGTGADTWSVAPMPSWMTLTGATLTGTPKAAGTWNFTITVTDSTGTAASQALSVTAS